MPPSPINDRTCICIDGATFQTGVYDPSQPCTRVTRCDVGQEEFAAPTLSTDRVCVAQDDTADVRLSFPGNFDELIPSIGEERRFVSLLHEKMRTIPDIPELNLATSLAKGSIVSLTKVSPARAAAIIEKHARDGLFDLAWPGDNTIPATALSGTHGHFKTCLTLY